MLDIIVIILIVALMIFFNALYVAGEFAAVGARKSRIMQAAQEGNRLARMLIPVVTDSHKLDNYIAASQVGITLSSIVLGIYGQQQIAQQLSPLLADLPFLEEAAAAGVAAILVLIVLTTLQVVLGELVPKTVALRYPERVAMLTAVPMRWSSDIILKPMIVLLNGSGALILRLMGLSHAGGHQHVHSPEEIRILVSESAKGGLLNADDRRLLDNAFRIGELTAEEVVVPRNRLIAASVNTPVPELLKMAAESAYTRIPVYESDIDHLVGFVHLKDLFHLHHRKDGQTVQSIIRQAPYVPQTMAVNEVWNTMDQHDSYVVFVFDEYGGIMGMITREDLIEELIGEVQDEFDHEQALITPQGDHQYVVRGDVNLSYLNETLQLDLPNEYANTIGGLVLHEMGRIPQPGDQVEIDGVHFEVKKAERAIHEILVTLPQIAAVPTDEEVNS